MRSGDRLGPVGAQLRGWIRGGSVGALGHNRFGPDGLEVFQQGLLADTVSLRQFVCLESDRQVQALHTHVIATKDDIADARGLLAGHPDVAQDGPDDHRGSDDEDEEHGNERDCCPDSQPPIGGDGDSGGGRCCRRTRGNGGRCSLAHGRERGDRGVAAGGGGAFQGHEDVDLADTSGSLELTALVSIADHDVLGLVEDNGRIRADQQVLLPVDSPIASRASGEVELHNHLLSCGHNLHPRTLGVHFDGSCHRFLQLDQFRRKRSRTREITVERPICQQVP